MNENIIKDTIWQSKSGIDVIVITSVDDGSETVNYKFTAKDGIPTKSRKVFKIPFSELIRDYSRISITKEEAERVSSLNSDNYIKMDGEKDAFEGGAIRYTKTGKGRFDLIPGEVVQFIMEQAKKYFFENNNRLTVTQEDILLNAYDTHGYHRYYDTIINIVLLHYAPGDTDLDSSPYSLRKRVRYSDFAIGMCDMLHDLAIHYENGAEKYGVDNWKKGIPVTGGDRGGSFADSGLRHLNQYLLDMDDEPHHIACIWNFFGALWTILNENKEYILDEEVTE